MSEAAQGEVASVAELSGADALISLFDARDGQEIGRLADILGESIECLDDEWAKAAAVLPALRLLAAPERPRCRRSKMRSRARLIAEAPQIIG